MTQEQNTQTGELSGKNILLVEDDDLLAAQLNHVLDSEGALVTVKQYLDEAIIALRRRGNEYDLIILDIMLPTSEENVKQLQELQGQLDGIREILKTEDMVRQDQREELEKIGLAYARRKAILVEMESQIDREAGLKFLDEYAKKIKETELPPVFVLTAVGNRAAVARGLGLLDNHGDWVVKPIAPKVFLEKAIELIAKGKRKLEQEDK